MEQLLMRPSPCKNTRETLKAVRGTNPDLAARVEKKLRKCEQGQKEIAWRAMQKRARKALVEVGARFASKSDELNKCPAKVEQIILGRESIAKTRPLEEIRNIQGWLLPVEMERLDAYARQEAEVRKQLLAARWRDPAFLRPLLSASICAASQLKSANVKEIKEQKRYGRKYGTVDLVSLHELQTEIRAFDDVLRDSRQQLRKAKLKPLKCKKEAVQLLIGCLNFAIAEPVARAAQKCEAAYVVEAREIFSYTPFARH